MRQIENVLTYARKQAVELQRDMEWKRSEHGGAGGWWAATDPTLAPRIAARAAAALEFFRQYAGADSFWTDRANSVYQSKGDNQSSESGARAIGDLLLAWAEQVEAGVVEIVGSRGWSEVELASTDLMMQVRRLLEDRNVHPAAPIVLCGAALEIALRGAAEAFGVVVTERPTLSALTTALRQAALLTKQDVKDLEQCGGVRNLAAHGDFTDLSPERAGLMEQQTNLLLRRIADLSESPK